MKNNLECLGGGSKTYLGAGTEGTTKGEGWGNQGGGEVRKVGVWPD